MNEGFLGTAAPAYADLTVLLETAMGVGLLIGAMLARRKRFREHAWCQSAIVLANLVLIVVVMAPSFFTRVGPKLWVRFGSSYYALAAAHAAFGAIAEIASIYILLAAGTNMLPEKFRISRYRLWMRSVLALWWFALVSGMAVYARWYMRLRW